MKRTAARPGSAARKLAVVIAFVVAAMVVWRRGSQFARVDSPDHSASLTLSTRQTWGLPMLGGEPPRTREHYARVRVGARVWAVHDTGLRAIGRFQAFPFAFDAVWAPDSSRVAYRWINTLRIVDRRGGVVTVPDLGTNTLISTFRWRSDTELLVVAKEITDPVDMHGYPVHYHAYLTKAKSVTVARVNLAGEVTRRFTEKVREPTFMFDSVGFRNEEISPDATRVAWSDGTAVCVYDDTAGQVTARVPVDGSVEGTWWETGDRLIAGLGLLSASSLRFTRIDLPDARARDATTELLPRWNRKWDRLDWHRVAGDTGSASRAR